MARPPDRGARLRALRRSRADRRFPARRDRNSERRSHVLPDGTQRRARRRPDVSRRRSSTGMARILNRPRRRLPEKGTAGDRRRLFRPPAVHRRQQRAGRRRHAAVFRQIVHLSARRITVRPFLRDERVSHAARVVARRRRPLRVFIPAHTAGRGGRRAARVGVRHGVGGAGVLRVDYAGAVQLHAGRLRVFLLAL